MGRADETTTVQTGSEAAAQRRRVVVDVILLLTAGDKILLRERANTGYGDGAYEPPSGQLADRETIVETAIRVARDEAGILIGPENVSLAHVMHDVSGSGRIAFFLATSCGEGEPTSPDVRWFPVWNLPTNMLDRARVALRNCADGMRFSTYPAFAPPANGPVNGRANGRVNGFTMASGYPPPAVAPAAWAPAPWLEACGARLVG
ncbi:MAG: NUDIX domain-containing protein [Streptosporangiaceae bacterium]